jgi:hypothetical protein
MCIICIYTENAAGYIGEYGLAALSGRVYDFHMEIQRTNISEEVRNILETLEIELEGGKKFYHRREK